MSRKSIAETMAFALDHSDCASEVMLGVPTVQLTMKQVIGVITDSLTLKQTAAATKVHQVALSCVLVE